MERPYVYYDFTLSLCSRCLRRVDAKVVFEDDRVFMLKRCPEHGPEKVLIADDVEYYRNSRNYAKRQVTWFRKYGNWTAFHPDDLAGMQAWIAEQRT